MTIVVSLPGDELTQTLAGMPGITPVRWDLREPPPRTDLDLVVVPYLFKAPGLTVLQQVGRCAVQSQSIGYDGVAALVRSQAEALRDGRPLRNVVIES